MNLPATLKEYCLNADIDYDEDRDNHNEELYKDMVGYIKLLSQFERIPLTEDKKKAFFEEFDVNMCIKHDNSYHSQMIIGQIERVIDDIIELGPEYGFLLDIIIGFFIVEGE